MNITYYEVTEFTPYLDYRYNVSFNGKSLGFYSTVAKAEDKIRDWCWKKGIVFDEHYCAVNEYNAISVCGLFFDISDYPVTYKDNWEYGTYCVVSRKDLVLDKDEENDKEN